MRDDGRPDPDALLDRAKLEEARALRGKLKIFFGMAPGVGKTFAMLGAARARLAEGREVVVGVVETHGRADTAKLIEGLELIPLREIDYKGVRLRELDLDAVLARKPSLVLVDELAHTNAPGSRHRKRWQDVLEILDAGIDAYTTINVQHLESLNDVVAQVSGIIVRETVPDRLLDEADEVELVDLPPDDLLQRLREGKVYLPEQALRAKEKFFRKGNLIALRELALRKTADRVDEQMLGYRRDEGIERTWPTRERVVVSVGPSPLSARLIRRASRMAEGLRAEWIALYVETPTAPSMPQDDRDRVARHLRLAETLGATTAIVSGQRVSEEICAYSRAQNATKIVIGKPTHPRWRDFVFGSLVDDVVRGSGDVDVLVITGDDDEVAPSARPGATAAPAPIAVLPYLASLIAVGAATAICWIMFDRFDLADLIMVYLLAVIAVAYRFDRGPSYFTSVISVAALDFFFIPPFGTFAVSDVRHLLTFAVMLLVGALISQLTTRIRGQVAAARVREMRTAALYRLGRELASITTTHDLGTVSERHVSEAFEGQSVVLMPNRDRKLSPIHGSSEFALDEHELGVASWVLERGQSAGLGTDTLPGATAMYLPLRTSRGTIGVLGVRPLVRSRLDDPAQRHLLETFASQIAVALERSQLDEEAGKARVQVETEQLRNALLSSVSHDLRTPLATITGAASTLLDTGVELDDASRTDLMSAIRDEAERLGAIVRNLLDVTRLEAGSVKVSREWNSIEELVGSALARVGRLLAERPVEVKLASGIPLVNVDTLLIEQVLVHLLENAAKYSPSSSPIEIAAVHDGSALRVEVRDHGPGLPPGDEEHVFEKFYRALKTGAGGGVGLGLTIARGIVAAHGGRMWAENHPGGGAVFRFTLPQDEPPPSVEPEL